MRRTPNPSHARRNRWLIAGASLLVLVLIAAAANSWLCEQLRQQLLAVAEPGSSLGRVSWNRSGITLTDVRLKAPADWPQSEILVAPKIILRPAWTSLWSEHPRLHEIQLPGAQLSLRRTAQRRLQVLPGLVPKAGRTTGSGRAIKQLTIEAVTLSDCTLDLYDATVATPPTRLRLSDAQVQLKDLQLPVRDARTAIQLTARLPGSPTGHVQIQGWSNLGSHQSSLQTTLSTVDLRVVEPYLLKAQPSGFAGGSLDLQLNSQVHDGHVVAPGRIVLGHLKLASNGPLQTLLSLPRAAVIAALEDKNQRIELDFTLRGVQGEAAELELNEPVLKQLAFVVAEALGLTLGGVAEGIGEVGLTGVKTVGSVFGFVLGGAGLLPDADEPGKTSALPK